MVGELGRGIVAGTIPEGSILPGDHELSLRFGVSRTVLREAMKTLAAKRLIEPKAKVGTRVLGHASWNFFDPDVLSWRFEAGFDEPLSIILPKCAWRWNRLLLLPPPSAPPATRSWSFMHLPPNSTIPTTRRNPSPRSIWNSILPLPACPAILSCVRSAA
ncbi:GntR domain-containing protein [Brucella pinnipedialis M163/99/10]|uniref:GntR domain-containing protein n=1 Tax=Brucella pinnipedialis (strain NCTC 12890 / B2/94 / BCCN 94-73) TaxID=520461 RepID=A0ABM9ZN85_BRUPB|nr:GntR domain-containing protein [Brucella pinnipedialis B2/94]EEY05520.1 GntR domain-containing protein [Brucella pinnipedialis M163/99/10]